MAEHGNFTSKLWKRMRKSEALSMEGCPNIQEKPRNLVRTDRRKSGSVVRSDEEARSSGEDEDPSGQGGCHDPRVCWWEPPKHSLPLEFCTDTSLHGLKYLSQPKRHLSERIFWFLAFLIGCSAAVYLISDVWRKYKESPVIVSFESIETNVDQIPFPAITICNMNKVLRSKAEAFTRQASQQDGASDPATASEAEKNLYYLDHVCSSSRSFTRKLNVSFSSGVGEELIKKIAEKIESQATNGTKGKRSDVREFLSKASQKCAEMIRLCTWRDKIANCTEIFRPVETDFGKCCTFNMVPQTLLHKFRTDSRDDLEEIRLWNLDNLEETWLQNVGTGTSIDHIRPRRQVQAGKSFGLSILIDPDLDEYYCTTSDSTGFRMVTHLSTDNPHIIDYGTAIMPDSEVFIKIRPEITKADPTLHGYPLSTRKCYFPYEYNLTFYEYYTPSNCVDECIAETIFQTCGCVRYYMPRNDNRALCGPSKFSCSEGVAGNLTAAGLKRHCGECLPSCTEISYFDETTTTPLQSDRLNASEAYGPNFKPSIVHIFFGQDSVYARTRKELYGTTDLFANSGGLMGLCLGFSGLSAMEVIYFLTLRAWCRKRREKTIRAKVVAKFRGAWAKMKNIRKYRSGGDNDSLAPAVISSAKRISPVENTEGHTLNGPRVFNRIPMSMLINEKSNKRMTRVLRAVGEGNGSLPPTYNSIINEISPFYAQRDWARLELIEQMENQNKISN